jgi:hypothetical protein
VSTVKELAKRWAPTVAGRRQEQQPHRAERRARFDRRAAPLPPVHGRAVEVAGGLNNAGHGPALPGDTRTGSAGRWPANLGRPLPARALTLSATNRSTPWR